MSPIGTQAYHLRHDINTFHTNLQPANLLSYCIYGPAVLRNGNTLGIPIILALFLEIIVLVYIVKLLTSFFFFGT